MRKQFVLFITLMLVALLTIVGIAAAEGTYTEGDWELRTLDDGSKEVVKFLNKEATEAVVPEGVTSIGNSAFYDCRLLIGITIPDSVTSIGKSAFGYCTSLASITIPDSVTNIGEDAFWQCNSLSNITIPDSVTSIGEGAFNGCLGLADESGLVIVNNVIYDCREDVTIVTIPDGVTSIGNCAFEGCRSLQSISIPNSVTSIGGAAFRSCTALTNIVIPDSVTRIGECAFEFCASLFGITIPDGVTKIEGSTFHNCSFLCDITLPNSVTSIETAAFYGCTSLTSITIPDSVTNIDWLVFRDCTSLSNVFVTPGSCAEQYVKDNKLPYTYSNNLKESLDHASVPYKQLCGDWQVIDAKASDIYYGTITLHFYNDKTGKIECRLSDDKSLFISLVIDYYNEVTGKMLVQISDISGDREMMWMIALSNYDAGEKAKKLNGQIEDGVLTLTDFRNDYIKCIPTGISAGLADNYSVNEQLYGDWQSIPSREGEPVICMSFEQEGNHAILMTNSADQVRECTFQVAQDMLILTTEIDGMSSSETFTYQLSEDGQSLSLTENGYTINLVRTIFEPGLAERMQAGTENSDTESGEIADDLDEQTIEGQVSSTISWRLSAGTLYIEGTGEMPDYEYPTSEEAPWTPYREEILSIIVSEGITELGNYNFPRCENLKNVQLPQTLRYIGGGVFASDSSLEVIAIPDSVTSTSWDVFYGCKSLRSVVLSSNLTKISSNVFYGTSPDLVIYGEAGSYVQTYAKNKGISFSTESCPDSPDNTAERNNLYSVNEQLFGDWLSIPSHDGEPVISMTIEQEGNRVLLASDNSDQFIVATFQETQGTLVLTREGTEETEIMAYQLSEDGQSLSLTENGYTINLVRTIFEPSLAEQMQAGTESAGIPDALTVGDTVIFGAYPQTAEGIDNSPIEWQVLNRDGDKVLLISRYGLDMQPYNKAEGDTTWAKCTLRAWLNDTFMNRAFTSEEQESIITTNVPNDKSQGYNSYNDGGVDTQDKIFLLSCSEVKKYYNLNDAQFYGEKVFINTRIAPTAYAQSQGADIYSFKTKDGEPAGWWWLRSPGWYQSLAAYILPNGQIGNVDSKAGWDIVDVMVRPALWIDLAGISASEDGTYAFEKYISNRQENIPTASASEIIVPNGTTSIDPWAFKKCSSLISVTIPDSVTSIGSWAFYQCTALTSVTIPKGVTVIEEGTFYECTALTSVIIPDSVTAIKAAAFAGCLSLDSVTIPESVTSISVYAFDGCTALTHLLVMPGSYAEQYAKDNSLPFAYSEGNP